jgi:hypothetical protein
MSEPMYVTSEDDFTGPHGNQPAGSPFALRADFVEKVKGLPAVRGWWMCPECKMEFMRRTPCEKHMGMIAGLPAQCLVMYGNLARLKDPHWDESMDEAVLRDVNAKKRGYKPAYGCKPEDSLKMHKIGVPCERAYYLWIDEPWVSTEGTYRAPDCLGTFQIRGGKASHYDLRTHPTDRDDLIMVLVLPTHRYRIYRVVGWRLAKDCKQEKYWHDRYEKDRPAYWMPQNLLHSWRDLPKMVAEARLAMAR